MFSGLPLAYLPSIVLLPIGRTTVSHDLFASAVGAMNSGDDHGISAPPTIVAHTLPQHSLFHHYTK
jgi:hypothetical protein